MSRKNTMGQGSGLSGVRGQQDVLGEVRRKGAGRLALALALGVVAADLSPLVSHAAYGDATWTGATSQNWNDATNWNPNPPTGNFFVNTASGNTPVINANTTLTPVDLILGDGVAGQIDQSAGTLALANTSTNGNWMFVGRGGGTGTYNLTGSGSLAVGKLWVGGEVFAENGTGTVNINTTGSVTANSTDDFSGWGQYQASVIVGWGHYPTGSSTAILNLQNGTINANGQGMFVGAWGSNSTVNQTGGTINTVNLSIARWFGTGTMNVSNGTVNASGGVWVSRAGSATDADYGTLNVNGGGTVNSENDFVVGFAGDGATQGSNGTLNIATGGTVNVASTTKRWMIVNQWDTVQGNINLNGGTLNLNANTDLRFSTGNGTGTSVVNLNSGSINSYSGNQTGTTSTGVVDLNQAGGANANNTFNLNGGTLAISQVITNNDNGTAAFNFNGGTLKATNDSTDFVDLGGATQVANVRNGGAIIDTNGHNVTVVQPLVHSTISGDNATDGGLTKNGAGVLTMTGTHTYNGATTVNAGTLALANGSLASSVTVAGGAGFAASGSSTVAGLSFANTGTFTIDLGTDVANNPAVLNIVNALNIGGGAVTLNINHTGPLSSGTYDLASLGSLTGTSSNLIQGTIQGLNTSRQTAKLNISNTALTLSIVGAVPIWHGVSSTNWSTNTADTAWNVNGSDSYFLTGDDVQFDDSAASSNVTVVGTVQPNSMTFNNNTLNYTISGSGTIAGSGTLLKLGTGTVTIGTSNTYSGGTTINAGQVNINSNTALGTGTLAITGAATVDNTSGAAVTAANAVSLGNTLTVAGTNDLVLNGAITGTGGLVKSGAAALTVGGAATYTGATTINGGTFNVTGSINNKAAIVANSGATLNIPGTVSAGAVDSHGAVMNITGTVAETGSQTSDGGVTNISGNASVTSSGEIWAGQSGTGTINQSGGTVTTSAWLAVGRAATGTYNLTGGTLNVATSTVGSFATLGSFAGSNGTLNVSGGTLTVASNRRMYVGEGGTGTLNVSGSGAVNVFDTANGGLRLGANSGAVGTVNLDGGTITASMVSQGAGTGTFNFNGGTLKAAGNSTSYMANLAATNVRNGGAIIDSNGHNITVAQALQHSTIAGDNAIDGGLTKNGAGDMTVSGVSTYTGATRINGGTLHLPAGAAPAAVGVYSFDNVTDASGNTVNSGTISTGYIVKNTGTGGSGMNGTVNDAQNAIGSSGGSIVPGKFGNALELDGLGSTVDIANKIVDQSGAGSWTLSAWVKTSTPGSAFVSKNTGTVPPATTEWAGGYSTFYLATNPPNSTAGNYPTAVRNGGGFLQGNVSVADGNWHMVTFTDNAGSKAIYVDGVQAALSATAFNNADTSSFVRLGYNTDTLANLDGNVNYAGDLDEVNFFGAALSPSQVQQLFASNTVGNDSTQYLPASTPVSITASGATLDLNGTNQAIGSLSGVAGSAVTLGTATLTAGGDNTSTNFAGGITGSGGIAKAGSGVWTLSGVNNYGGSTAVSAGSLKITGTTKTSGLTVASGASLDLGGKLILDYSASGTSPLSTILPQLQASRGTGAWAGTTGLISTAAQGDANHITTIGYAEASQLLGASGGTWNGVAVNGKSLILKYTYYGDLNLDGKINADDYALIDRGYAKHLTGWVNGDVNYDGVINSADYLLMDTAFGKQSGVLSPDLLAERQAEFGSAYVAALTAAVPEPASLSVIGLAAVGLMGRRRRK